MFEKIEKREDFDNEKKSKKNTDKHSWATGQDNIGVEISTDIDVTLHDGIEGGVMNTFFDFVLIFWIN